MRREKRQSSRGANRKLTNPGAKAIAVMPAIRASGRCCAASNCGMVIKSRAPFTPSGHSPKPRSQMGG